MLMSAGRDRSRFAIVEIGAAGLLIVSLFLSWFEVTFSTGAASKSLTWANYQQTGFDSSQWPPVYLIPLGAMAAAIVSGVAVVLPRRWTLIAVLAAFVAAFGGLVWLMLPIDAERINPHGYASLSPGIGLLLFGAAAVLGATIALVDLALAGASVSASRRPRAKMTGVALAGIFAAAAAIFRPFPPQPPSALIEHKESDPLLLRVEPGPRLDNEQPQRPDPRGG